MGVNKNDALGTVDDLIRLLRDYIRLDPDKATPDPQHAAHQELAPPSPPLVLVDNRSCHSPTRGRVFGLCRRSRSGSWVSTRKAWKEVRLRVCSLNKILRPSLWLR